MEIYSVRFPTMYGEACCIRKQEFLSSTSGWVTATWHPCIYRLLAGNYYGINYCATGSVSAM